MCVCLFFVFVVVFGFTEMKSQRPKRLWAYNELCVWYIVKPANEKAMPCLYNTHTVHNNKHVNKLNKMNSLSLQLHRSKTNANSITITFSVLVHRYTFGVHKVVRILCVLFLFSFDTNKQNIHIYICIGMREGEKKRVYENKCESRGINCF